MPIELTRLHRKPFELRYQEFVPLFCDVLVGRPARIPPCGPAGLSEAAWFHKASGALISAASEDTRLASWIGREEFDRLVERHCRAVLWTRALGLELERVEPLIGAANGEPPIVLKGVGLAETLYADPSMRTSADIDVMVRGSRVAAAGAALAESGYGPAQWDSPWFMQSKHHAEFERPAGERRYLVEVHTRCVDDPAARPLDFDALRSRAVRLRRGGSTMLIPSPADQILLISLHLVADIARNLGSINDLRLAAGEYEGEIWSESFERALELNLLWPLHRAIDCVDHFFGLTTERPLPPGGRPAFGPLVAADRYGPKVAIHLGQFAAASWRRRAAYLGNLLWPPREQIEWLTDPGEDAGEARLRLRYLFRALGSVFRRRL